MDAVSKHALQKRSEKAGLGAAPAGAAISDTLTNTLELAQRIADASSAGGSEVDKKMQ